LTLQNGLGNEDRLAELFGAGRVLGGLAFTCINRLAAGEVDHIAHGLIKMGEFGGGASERVGQIAEIFKASNIECEVLESLKYGRWEKLVWNVPFNGLSAALDLTTDQILATAEGERLVRAIMQDVITAAAADGVTLPVELIENNLQRTRNMGAYRTSMHIDRTERRPMEVEAILGEPLRVAERAGAAVPQLRQLYAQVAMVAAAL
jgi:2-dehydropantoate 2-reductase